MQTTIHQDPGAVTTAECAAILEQNPEAEIPLALVQLPKGREPRPGYRNCRAGQISRPAAILERIQGRIAVLTDLPVENQEPPVLAIYRQGGHYGLHHDNPQSGPAAERMLATGGPRVVSVVVALTDEHDGGGLFFPDEVDLDNVCVQTVHPRLGWATWWSNKHKSARHQALEVEHGRRAVLLVFIRSSQWHPADPEKNGAPS